MLTIWDHLFLWGALFLLGIVLGFFLTKGLLSAGKYYRL